MSDCNPSSNIHMGFVWTKSSFQSTVSVANWVVDWCCWTLVGYFLMTVLYGNVRIQPGCVLKYKLYCIVFPDDVSISEHDNALVHMAKKIHIIYLLHPSKISFLPEVSWKQRHSPSLILSVYNLLNFVYLWFFFNQASRSAMLVINPSFQSEWDTDICCVGWNLVDN